MTKLIPNARLYLNNNADAKAQVDQAVEAFVASYKGTAKAKTAALDTLIESIMQLNYPIIDPETIKHGTKIPQLILALKDVETSLMYTLMFKAVCDDYKKATGGKELTPEGRTVFERGVQSGFFFMQTDEIL